jgi:hypothetical protein
MFEDKDRAPHHAPVHNYENAKWRVYVKNVDSGLPTAHQRYSVYRVYESGTLIAESEDNWNVPRRSGIEIVDVPSAQALLSKRGWKLGRVVEVVEVKITN